MKSVLQIFVSVVFGSLLGLSLYNKLLTKNPTAKASEIVTDLSLFTDDADFIHRKRAADSLAYAKYQDSLQRAILFVETESVKPKTAAVSPSKKINIMENPPAPAPISKPKVSVQHKIEVSELKNKNTITIPVTEIGMPENIEVTTISTSPSAVESAAPATDGAAQSQPQADKKKKFLFFNKRNNTN